MSTDFAYKTKIQRSVSTANKTLAFYQSLTGSDGEDLITDLLADLMHWCDVNPRSTNVGKALGIARDHYFAEKKAAAKGESF